MLPKYECEKCKAKNCKLWRNYNSFTISLKCLTCAGRAQNVRVDDVDEKGKTSMIENDVFFGRTYCIGWLVPAIPTIENDAYWGYCSVPSDRLSWWESLPNKGN